MTTPPDDRRFRREMAVAHRSGWHLIDLLSALPEPGDSLMVTILGEPVVVCRNASDGELEAYRCLRRPRGAPQPVRCVIRYGMIFVNLQQGDHEDISAETLRTVTPQSA
ncbi:(2Fe-2S)-binding protein [Streptomyces sp. SID10853]|uniref:(2Fe-2S)-binding protein n=1 Tax=Streptomyces sp. SID10853 TaxID=2706028 RepID=UPI0013C0CA7D|nr:(2Fe-2S)-binding protein [Streptomyces sp. SID10853]NDZ79970.1 (2Fe-2S)-binding protein [Streptomyces sp. SID10853]